MGKRAIVGALRSGVVLLLGIRIDLSASMADRR